MDVTLVVLLTNRCNKDCSFCFMAKGTRELSFREFVTSFKVFYQDMESRNAGNRYSIVFMGGEPLLNFEVLEKATEWLLRTISEDQLRLRVVTNGILLRSQQSWFKKNPRIQVAVSSYDIKLLDAIFLPQMTVKVVLAEENIDVLASRIIDVARRGFFVECTLADGQNWIVGQHAPKIKKFFKTIQEYFCQNYGLPPPDILTTAVWTISEKHAQCCPGITSFCMDVDGRLYDCDRITPSFNHGAFKLIYDIKNPPPISQKCMSCKFKNLCSICPAAKASIHTRDQADTKCLYVHEAIFASVSYLSELTIKVAEGIIARNDSHFLKHRPNLTIATLARGCYETGSIISSERRRK